MKCKKCGINSKGQFSVQAAQDELWLYGPEINGIKTSITFFSPNKKKEKMLNDLWAELRKSLEGQDRCKEPVFVPEEFSGLNWRDAEKLVGKVVEFSYNASYWNLGILEYIDKKDYAEFKFGTQTGVLYTYIRTTPETFKHPTITITVNGKEYKLPKPETEAPKMDTPIWVFNIYTISETRWCGAIADSKWLKGGCVHLTEDRAQAWADYWENTVMAAVKGVND